MDYKEAIIELLEKCDNETLLKLIYKILIKA